MNTNEPNDQELPYLVTLTAQVVVEVEIEARSEEEAAAKAEEWQQALTMKFGTVSGYTGWKDGNPEYRDEKFDVVWEIMDVSDQELVGVEELADDAEWEERHEPMSDRVNWRDEGF